MPIIVQPPSSPGSTVALKAVWLNNAADPSDSASFIYVTSLTPTTTARGSVRVMANGRQRLVNQAGIPHTYPVTLTWNNPGQIAWLEAHVGQVVCVRDPLGYKLFGVYFDVPVDELLFKIGTGNVSLSITEVTFSEAI